MTTLPNDTPPTIPAEPPVLADAAPVDEAGRMVSLDLLRGFAVLGILAMNIVTFATIFSLYQNPTAMGKPSDSDYRIWVIHHLFADLKFMSIFSMLFGAGVVLMTSRAEKRTGRSAAVHYRRMGWLALIGFLHAHVLWYGDILFMYAMLGLVLYLFRKLSPTVLVILAIFALLTQVAVMTGLNAMLQFAPPEQLEQQKLMWEPTQEMFDEQVAAYQGGWLDQATERTPFALMFQLAGPIFFGPRIISMMLLGMALFKWGVLTAKRSKKFYGGMFALGMGIGLPLILYGVKQNEAHEWSYDFSASTGMNFNYFGSVAVALGWIGLVMLAAKSDARRLFAPLAAAGRMALTNYLLQTVICTTIFYGHGFGLFGTFNRAEMLMTVIGVWIFELILSPIWLSYFRFGPMEWLWRSLTYWKRQPMRRNREAPTIG